MSSTSVRPSGNGVTSSSHVITDSDWESLSRNPEIDRNRRRDVSFEFVGDQIVNLQEFPTARIKFKDVYDEFRKTWMFDDIRPFLVDLLNLDWYSFCTTQNEITKDFVLSYFKSFLDKGILIDPWCALRGVLKGKVLDSKVKNKYLKIWKYRSIYAGMFDGVQNTLINLLFLRTYGKFDVSWGPIVNVLERQCNATMTNDIKKVCSGERVSFLVSCVRELSRHRVSEIYWRIRKTLMFLLAIKNEKYDYVAATSLYWRTNCNMCKFQEQYLPKWFPDLHYNKYAMTGYIIESMKVQGNPYGLSKQKAQAQMGPEIVGSFMGAICEAFKTMFSMLGTTTIGVWVMSFGSCLKDKLKEWYEFIKNLMSKIAFWELMFKMLLSAALVCALYSILKTMSAVMEVLKAISHLFWGAIPSFDEGEIGVEATVSEAQSFTSLFGVAGILSFMFGECITLKRIVPAFQMYGPGKGFLQDLQEFVKPMWYWAMAKYTGDPDYSNKDDLIFGMKIAQDYHDFVVDNPMWTYSDQTLSKVKDSILEMYKKSIELDSRLNASTSLQPTRRSQFKDICAKIRKDYEYLLMNEPSLRERPPPTVVILKGAPKQGKTEMSLALIKAVYLLCKEAGIENHGFPLGDFKPTEAWSKSPDTTYWDGYAHQFCYYMTELANQKDVTIRAAEFSEFLRLADNIPFPCNMAFGDKGRVFFSSRLIVITTNFDDFHNIGMTDTEAVVRRFDFPVEVSKGKTLPKGEISAAEWDEAWKLRISAEIGGIPSINDDVLNMVTPGNDAEIKFSTLCRMVADKIIANSKKKNFASEVESIVEFLKKCKVPKIKPIPKKGNRAVVKTVSNKAWEKFQTADDKGKEKDSSSEEESVSEAQIWEWLFVAPVLATGAGLIVNSVGGVVNSVVENTYLKSKEITPDQAYSTFLKHINDESYKPTPQEASALFTGCNIIDNEDVKWKAMIKTVGENTNVHVVFPKWMEQVYKMHSWDEAYFRIWKERFEMLPEFQNHTKCSFESYPTYREVSAKGWMLNHGLINDDSFAGDSFRRTSDYWFKDLAPIFIKFAAIAAAATVLVLGFSKMFQQLDESDDEYEVQAQSMPGSHKDPAQGPKHARRAVAHSDSLTDKALAAAQYIKKVRLIGQKTTLVSFVLVSGFGFFSTKHAIAYIGGTLLAVEFLDPEGNVINRAAIVYWSELEGRDLIVAEFDKGPHGAFPNIEKKLMHKDETLKRTRVARVAKRLRFQNSKPSEHTVIIIGNECERGVSIMSNETVAPDQIEKIKIKMKDYIIARGCRGQPGDCMFPYISEIEQQRYIMGVHVGACHEDSIIAPIHYDDLTRNMRVQLKSTEATERKIQPTALKEIEMSSEAQNEFIIAKIPHIPGLDPVCETAYPEFIPTDDGFVETVIAEELPKLVAPAMLTFEKVDGITIDPRANMLKKYGERKQVKDYRAMHMLFEEPLKYTTNFPRPTRTVRKLSLKEALEGGEGIESTKFNASVTWDLREKMVRQNLMKKDKNGKVTWIAPELARMVEVIEKDMADPDYELISSATLCFKAELRSLESRMKGKTRGFQVVSFVISIVCKMYVGDLMAALKDHWVNNSSGPGVDPTHFDWEKIVDFINQISGDNCLAADCGGWDLSVKFWMWITLHAYFCEVFSLNPGCPDFYRYRCIARSCLQTYLVYGKYVYRLYDGICSGHYLTSFANTFFNNVIHECCFHILKPEDCKLKFREVVKIIFYGDDNLGKVAQEIAEWFNMQTLEKAFDVYFGMNYTNANKTAVNQPFVSLKEVDFLSRKFKIEERTVGSVSYREVFSPLSEEAIYGMLSWVRKPTEPGVTVMDQLKINIDTAQREIYQHGEERYNSFVEEIGNACRKHKVQGIVFKTYDYWDSCRLESRIAAGDSSKRSENALVVIGTNDETALRV